MGAATASRITATASNTAMGINRATANSTAISKVMGNRVVTVATRATATKAMASNMDMVMSSKVMAMAETRAMDNMVVMVATKVMVIKAVMVAIRAMAMRAMVATKAMAMRGMVATKAMAVSLIRAMGSKATTVATRAMDSKEATVETKAMANKITMVATRAMNSPGMASIRAPNTNNSLATARTKVPSTSKGLATPSNLRSNTIIITAENTRRTPATSLPSHTVKRDLGTPWIW